MRFFSSIFIILALFTLPAMAEEPVHGHAALAAPAAADAASTREYKESMDKMHKDMMVAYTGDADMDLVKGMIPHHQGAVKMCKTELKYGRDAGIRKLCEGIVAGQEKEIAMMKEWLSKRGK